MTKQFEYEPGFEPERYELDERARYRFKFRRRDFVKSLGGGLVVFLVVKDAVAQEAGRNRRRGGGGRTPPELGAWLHINEKGEITVYTGKVEVGQNIRTSLTQAVAEELRAPMSSIRLVMADTQLTPYDGGTAGSRTTPDMAQRLRRVGATAREALVEMAAELWKAEAASLSVKDGKVFNAKNDQSVGFGELTKGQKLTKVIADNATATPANEWKVSGVAAPKVDAVSFVTGKHKYTSDVSLPGMLHGKVLRPLAFGSTLVSADIKAAQELPGVIAVHDGNFVGVAAPDELQAIRALKAIKAEWNSMPQVSESKLFEHFKKEAGQSQGGRGNQKAGSIAEGLNGAEVRLEKNYTIAYIAHAPLEPRAAVANWENGKLTVWTGTQRPFGVRGELVDAFKVPEENVRVIVPDTGSGYGGKHTGDAAVEAARLAKAAGKPVKLVWTREEEFTWAYFRPAGLIEVRSGARKDGTLTAWEFHNYNSGGSGIATLYEAPNLLVESHSTRSPLRQGSYRALASTANVFARETHMDELAHELKIEPLEFRLKNLKNPRLRAVFEAAAKTFGWGKTKPAKNHGFGIGGGSEKGSYVATCAEVRVDPSTREIQVIRAVSAFECGAVVNPDHLKSQVEGCMMMGLGGALFEVIHFEDGKILNPRFSKYRVPRFSDAPQIEVVLLDRKDLPSAGAGETPIVGIAPAIGNAIFAATGVRLRSLPLTADGKIAGT